MKKIPFLLMTTTMLISSVAFAQTSFPNINNAIQIDQQQIKQDQQQINSDSTKTQQNVQQIQQNAQQIHQDAQQIQQNAAQLSQEQQQVRQDAQQIEGYQYGVQTHTQLEQLDLQRGKTAEAAAEQQQINQYNSQIQQLQQDQQQVQQKIQQQTQQGQQDQQQINQDASQIKQGQQQINQDTSQIKHDQWQIVRNTRQINQAIADASTHFIHEFYFYPIFSSASLTGQFDRNQVIADATSNFPQIAEMSGISIIISWAQLCPAENACDFGMIDSILDYWGSRGKKVVLAVSTTGAPIEKIVNGKPVFVSATPAWLLDKVAVYHSPSNNFIGNYLDWKNMANNPNYQFAFPRYDDKIFLTEIGKLVWQLGKRYDGNPALAYMRIGTGKDAEDNPYGRANGYGPGTGMPGWTNSLYINYSREVANIYFAFFHKTQLEFDIGWTAIVAANVRTATPIAPGEPQEAQQFLDYLVRRNVFIADDGVAPQPTSTVPGATAANPAGVVCPGYSATDANTPALIAAGYAEIEHVQHEGNLLPGGHLSHAGHPVGFEGNALSDPCMAPDRLRAIFEHYRPVRFIFFGDAAAAINFYREGINNLNNFEVEALTNSFVPWTTYAQFPAHEAAAMPKIKAFGEKMDLLVRDLYAGPKNNQ